jgi:hypothetical protein
MNKYQITSNVSVLVSKTKIHILNNNKHVVSNIIHGNGSGITYDEVSTYKIRMSNHNMIAHKYSFSIEFTPRQVIYTSGDYGARITIDYNENELPSDYELNDLCILLKQYNTDVNAECCIIL